MNQHEANRDRAALQVRRNEEIFSADGGWFRARWHFSFDQYHNPKNMGIGTLRVFNHDTLMPGAIWPMHPHRDVEGITYVVAGEFEHADSLGNGGVLYPGGVQRMRLGTGAEHSERNHSPSSEMQFLQLWILPSEQGLEPSVEQRQYQEADRLNKLLQVLRPEGSDEQGIGVYQDARIYVSRLEDGASIEHEVPPGHGGYFYLVQGRLDLNADALASGDAAYIRDGGYLSINARTTCELILVDTILEA
ncbi:MAG: pirin family protein [Dehalococcoidia bacterium]|nr:pirin family protein [Dehalococcoidia bacterium]